jgi:hypothetical protein
MFHIIYIQQIAFVVAVIEPFLFVNSPGELTEQICVPSGCHQI